MTPLHACVLARLATASCLGLPLAAGAQVTPGALEREMLLRRQYQDELLLRQRQLQELTPELTPGQRRHVERRQFDERSRQRMLADEQERRLPAEPSTPPPDAAPYRAEQFDREREQQMDRFREQPER